jgi:hypothetical protein
MKQITLNIPDEKFPFFIELIENMDFVSIIDDYDIPELHQKLVIERFEKVKKNPDRLLDWDKVKKSLKA